jgi:glycosyltransferase involved in cell wall biosynthesis
MWLGGLDVSRHAIVARKIIETVSPDVVHALRIPFEGILAAAATPPGTPLILSVWGNDFTMFASRYPMIGTYTDDSLRRADALLCDCRRDLDLAVTRWGFDRDKPCEVLPGGGGVSLHDFNTGASTTELRIRLGIPPQAPVVLNPRGFRSYIDPELFFEAVRLVVDELPDVVCVCIGQQHVRASEDSVRRLGISGNVRLTSSVPHAHMADFFRLAEISVSPATHDGTPNTLLEAMACGSFPIAGELESIREWIADGVNGLLCDVSNPASLARAMIRSLRDHDLRQKARELNSAIVAERADYENVMPRAEEFYYRVIARKNGGNSNLSICAAS